MRLIRHTLIVDDGSMDEHDFTVWDDATLEHKMKFSVSSYPINKS